MKHWTERTRNTRWKDDLGMLRGRWIAAMFTAGVIGIILAAGVISYVTERSTCYAFGRQAHRDVRFVRYNIVSWDCLTPTRAGHWISTDNLRGVDDAR